VEQQKEGLESTLDVRVARAEWHYCRGSNYAAFSITNQLIEKHPDAMSIYPVHLGACLELNKKDELYLRGQELMRLAPDSALAHYASGVYYMCIKRYNDARRSFTRSKSRDKYFAPAWIGLGNTFAAQAETEQAMNAYRSTQRLFPGLHLPVVYIGMENLRLNNPEGAQVNFQAAYNLCTEDPLTLNQIGMALYQKGDYDGAIRWFERATGKLSSRESIVNWEAIHLNKGHALRKSKRFDEALTSYNQALACSTQNPAIYTAIGFTHHLLNDTTKATDYYWKALLYDEHDAFAQEMLQIAASEELNKDDSLFD